MVPFHSEGSCVSEVLVERHYLRQSRDNRVFICSFLVFGSTNTPPHEFVFSLVWPGANMSHHFTLELNRVLGTQEKKALLLLFPSLLLN